MDCLLELVRRQQHTAYGFREVVRLSCPLCRSWFLSSEINTVRPTEAEEHDVKVSGSRRAIYIGIAVCLGFNSPS